MGYVALTTSGVNVSMFVAYTTSRPWAGPKPPGVYHFTRTEAKGMGQFRPFTLDLRRMAAVPVTEEWFPDLNTPNHGTAGHTPERLRKTFENAINELFTRHPENIERLGPLWPGRRP